MTEYYESFGSEEYSDHEYSSDSVHYDFAERRWKCNCPHWQYHGACRHVRWFRRQNTLRVNEKYL